MIRRICIGLVAIGAALHLVRRDADIPILPFPAVGLLVKSPVTLASSGDYYLRVTMPKVGDAFAANAETVPCSLVVTVTEPGKPPRRKRLPR